MAEYGEWNRKAATLSDVTAKKEYPSIPKNEIWIDHAISCEEFSCTLMHELCERELMAVHGWTYRAAQDSALMVEQQLSHHRLHIKQ